MFVPHVRKTRSPGFTLIELLVVIAIVGVLAGLLMPAFSRARERSRQTACENNLKQFALALTVYRQDYGNDQLPGWLSDLYPKYIGNASTYHCKSDKSDGADGSKPDDMPPSVDDNQYKETDDVNRKPGIQCGYMYEFSGAVCTFGYAGFITNLPPEIASGGGTWQQVKNAQLRYGDLYNGFEAYSPTFFPIIRCFHHWMEMQWRYTDPEDGTKKLQGLTINVAYAGNIFRSGFYWEVPLSEMEEVP